VITADQVSAAAAVFTAIAAIVAIAVAKSQISKTREITREATATNLYNHCLEMSLEYPDLAEPALSGGFKKLVSDPKVAACYGWFIASVMLSCEEILAVTKNDPKWRSSVSATLDGHADYFRFRNEGHQPLQSFYSDEMAALIEELASNSDYPPEARAFQMARLSHA
jgi:hypothetical protein